MYKTIGILGGTFDPIHLGHLRMALELHDSLQLSKVHIIPCYQPVHRHIPKATPQVRLEMIKLAIADEISLCLDTREIDRQGPSYFIDTLLDLRQEMPDTSFCLLLGTDAFLEFTQWHRYQDIINNAHIIVAHRPNYQLPNKGNITELMLKHLQSKTSYIQENLAGGILFCPITSLDISASSIRKQIAMNKNPRYLLPDSVYDYLK